MRNVQCLSACLFFIACVITHSVWAQSEPANDGEHILLLDQARSLEHWRFYPGSEFPGATGDLGLTVGPQQQSCLKLEFDFTNGGQYVQGMRVLPIPTQVTHLSFRAMNHDGPRRLYFRVMDQTGQVFAAEFKLPDNQWHTFTQPIQGGAFEHHWGGAKDNVIHLPLKNVSIGANKHGPPTGAILIDRLMATVDRIDPKDMLSLKLNVNAPMATAVVGEDIHVDAVVQNQTGQACQAVLDLVLTDVDEKKQRKQYSLDLPAFSHELITEAINTDQPNFYTVDAHLQLPDQADWHLHQGVAVVPSSPAQNKVDPDAVMGLMYIPDYPTAQRIGCKFERLPAPWRHICRKNPQQYDWSQLDWQIQQAQANNVLVILTIRPTSKPDAKPYWATWQSYEELLQPPHIDYLKDFVTKLVQRYKDQVFAFEIGNEQDLDYTRTGNLSLERATDVAAKFDRMLYKLLKSMIPDKPIVGMSVSGSDMMAMDFSDLAVSKADGPIFDYFAGHPYSHIRYVGNHKTAVPPWSAGIRERFINSVAWLKRHHLNTDIWNTELGYALYPQSNLLSEDSRTYANLVAQGIITARTVPQLKKLTWFLMWLEQNERGYSYGLYEPNRQPRLAVCAYATAARMLYQAMPVGEVKVPTPDVTGQVIAWQFHAQSSARDTIVLWASDSPLVCKTSLPSDVSLVDMFGRQLNLSQDQVWQLDDKPWYLQFPTVQADAVFRWLKTCQFDPRDELTLAACYPTRDTQLTLKLINHRQQSLEVSCQLENNRTEHVLKPGDNRVIVNHPIMSRPSILYVASSQCNIEQICEYKFDRIPRTQTVDIDGYIDAETQGFSPITLDTEESIGPPDPNIGWEGAADLSCQAWFAWHKDGLYAAFRVTDDKHYASEAATSDFWRSDSVQIAVVPQNHTSTNFTSSDRELGMAWDGHQAHAWQSQPGPIRSCSDMVLKVRRQDAMHLIYETLIPWSVLGLSSPESGQIIGLNFLLNDDDGHGRQYWMGLTPGIADAKLPAMYKRFVLSD